VPIGFNACDFKNDRKGVGPPKRLSQTGPPHKFDSSHERGMRPWLYLRQPGPER